MQFEVGDKKVDRNLVFVKDSLDFVMNIISERALNPYNAIVRVSIDGGGGVYVLTSLMQMNLKITVII